MGKGKFSRYAIIIGQVVIGIIFLMVIKTLKATKLESAALLLTLFLLFNLSIAFALKIQKEIIAYWSLKKTYFLLIGVLVGAGIAFLPPFTAIVAGEMDADNLIKKPSLNFNALLITFLVVSWEELWFRSLLLNFCKQKLHIINISLFVGLLFMLLHVLNPEFDIVNSGLALFFAGTLLTIVYFYYENIWLPLGIHFGNNYLQSILTSHLDKNHFFANDGYMSAIILAALSMYFIIKVRSKEKKLKI